MILVFIGVASGTPVAAISGSLPKYKDLVGAVLSSVEIGDLFAPETIEYICIYALFLTVDGHVVQWVNSSKILFFEAKFNNFTARHLRSIKHFGVYSPHVGVRRNAELAPSPRFLASSWTRSITILLLKRLWSLSCSCNLPPMPPRTPQSYCRAFHRLFSRSDAFLRPSIRLSTSSPIPRRLRPYSTSPPNSQTRSRPNYRIAVLCGITAVGATWAVTRRKAERLDALPSRPGEALTSGARVEITGKDHGDEVDQIATGTSTIPYFPRTIWLPRSGSGGEDSKSAILPAGIGAVQEEEEYQLLGLGIRKVSLFRIQVYVVGLYVAKGDMGRLQEELVKASVGSEASPLVQGENQELKKVLLDGEGSTRIWTEVLKQGGVRSAVRVVPTRNTNFSHLRDGWIRGIDLRGKGEEFEGQAFQAAVGEFKGMLGGRGSVGKGKVLLLGRGTNGALRAWVEEETPSPGEEASKAAKSGKMNLLGGVKDERISRLVWMGYLAGDNIASEEARVNIVEGLSTFQKRPVGTIETQVVL